MKHQPPGAEAMQPPTLLNVYEARRAIAPYLRPTPLNHYPALSAALGCEAWLKLENTHPTGSFKVRGGINYMAHLGPDERSQGVITTSTGNHGQSIAYAAQLFQVPATVVVPEGPNPDKMHAMQQYGARVIVHGRDFDEGRAFAEVMARREGLHYVATNPLLIAGVATASLEIIEALPEVEVILVPIGGGSEAAGHCLVAKTFKPQVQVIGVQPERAPSFYLSWRAGKPVGTDSADTWAEGLATRSTWELPLAMVRGCIDDIVLVSEEEMRQAVLLLLRTAHQLAEASGAAATAAAVKLRERLAGRRVVITLSGGNITQERLTRVLTDPQPF